MKKLTKKEIIASEVLLKVKKAEELKAIKKRITDIARGMPFIEKIRLLFKI